MAERDEAVDISRRSVVAVVEAGSVPRRSVVLETQFPPPIPEYGEVVPDLAGDFRTIRFGPVDVLDRRCDRLKKIAVELAQHDDLSQSLLELVADIGAGRKRHKTYRQMKMYNDPNLNPYLYKAQTRS